MLLKPVVLAVLVAYAQGQGAAEFPPQAPSIQVAHLVPPGQVLLRWKAGAQPEPKPQGWQISHFELHALDTSTNVSRDFKLYPPSIMNTNTTDGHRHYTHIDEGELGRFSEYRFPKYSLEAGYYTFILRGCAEDAQSLADESKWCSEPSAESSPYVPVPGHTIADFTGDATSPIPGTASFVRASIEKINGSAAVTVRWGDPDPPTYTAFVVLANPNNDTTKRFAVSERLYANRREYLVPANVLHCSDDSSQAGHCIFTFQVSIVCASPHHTKLPIVNPSIKRFV